MSDPSRFSCPYDMDPADPDGSSMDDMPGDDLCGWLASLPDNEFDHVWVAAIMSTIVEDGISTSELAGVLSMCRNRMRGTAMPAWLVRVVIRIEASDATQDAIDRCRDRNSRL